MLQNRPDINLLYVHTTDCPMHVWAPAEPESVEHLRKLDTLIGLAREAARDAAFLVTADDGMNFKKRCWDLTRVCRNTATPIRFALSPERDYYVKHHRDFTGCAWLWLNNPRDAARVTRIIRGLDGV